jgi:hypothetical protein
MLKIESVNHVGIRVKDKLRSVAFYELLGCQPYLYVIPIEMLSSLMPMAPTKKKI